MTNSQEASKSSIEPSRAIDTSWVPLGFVARPHGVRGTLRVHWHDPIPPGTQRPAQVRLTLPGAAPRVFTPTAIRWQHDHALVDLADVTTREAAQALRGAEVALPTAWLPPLDEGELYLYLLMGDACEDTHGRQLGHLVHLYDHGAAPVLGIVPPGGGTEILVPLLETTLRKRFAPLVPGQPGRLILDVIEGLDDPS